MDYLKELVNKGILECIVSGENSANTTNSKKMLSRELALTFAESEIEVIEETYACLKETPMQIVEKICEEVIGQEEVIKKVVYSAYYNQFANMVEEIGFPWIKHSNIFLIGPTGCGKTSIVNALEKYFKVPVAKYSMDAVTSAGWVGRDVEDVLIRLYEKAKRDIYVAERGIIYLDEFDKKVNNESTSGRDVNGKAVQQELLKILEPSQVDLTLPDKTSVTFDTSKLTVILGGACVGLDDVRKKRLATKKSIGFFSDKEDETKIEMSHDYIPQDLIDYGFIPEIVGRTLAIAELRKLDKDDLIKIMLEGKNSPYRVRMNMLANYLNVDMYVHKEFLLKIAEHLVETGTGARALEAKIEAVFYEIFTYVFEHKGAPGICDIYKDGSYVLMYDDVTYYGEIEI